MLPFFKKSSVGIDIADRSIEVVALERKGEEIFVSGKSRVLLPYGVVEHGRIRNKEALAKAFQEVLKKAGVFIKEGKQKIIFGFPESQMYAYTTTLPKNEKDRDKENFLKKIEEEVIQSIPVPQENVLFSYITFRETAKSIDVLLIATRRDVAKEWQDFFREQKTEIHMFDVEPLAVFRGLFTDAENEPVCIVDIGARTTMISLFDRSGLVYSYTIMHAGDSFTEELSTKLSLTWDEAEALKRKDGVENYKGRAFLILVKSLEEINNEIRNAIIFFENKSNQKIRDIVLVGGGAYLRGIIDYFHSNLRIPVRIGMQNAVRAQLPLFYIEAVGLALRGVANRWNNRDPVFSPQAISKSILHKDVKEKSPQKIRKPSFIMSIKRKIIFLITTIVVIIIGGGVYWYAFGINKVTRSADTLNEDIMISKEEGVVPTGDSFSSEETNIVSNQSEENAEVGAQKQSTPFILPTVTITNTPTGWLNARKGAGTEYARVNRVYPGESYPLLEETEDGKWYKIQLNKVEVWIFAIYAKKDILQ